MPPGPVHAGLLLVLLSILAVLPRESAIQTELWYGDNRKPQTDYTTIPLVSMSVRIFQKHQSNQTLPIQYQEGPGVNLLRNPFNIDELLFAGNTISRQTFDVQFVLDLSYAVGIDPARVYVNYVKRGDVHYSWESASVIVAFYFLERNNSVNSLTLLEHIADLTNKIQIPTSKLYDKRVNITYGIDPIYGLSVDAWDLSLRLTYPIAVVGGNAVVDGYFLNLGARGTCDTEERRNYTTYCEFERFFEDDVSEALNISYYRIQINFIKQSSMDSVLVFFRITPPRANRPENAISDCIVQLIGLAQNMDSKLFRGNVTIRTDPLWGVSNSMSGSYNAKRRSSEALFTYKYYEYDTARLASPGTAILMTPYDRCKANHRCNWGIVLQNQTTNDVRYFQQLFDRGNLYQTNLFLDFEDWRLGSRGFNWLGTIAPTQIGATSMPKARAADGAIRGAHFWPFDQASLGLAVPCFLLETNQGLVLDRDLQMIQIVKQKALVQDLAGRIDWIGVNLEVINMDSVRRSRKDVRRNSLNVQDDFRKWHTNELNELRNLSSSACVNVNCDLVFDTSNLTMTGAIGTWKGVIRKTAAGTEVAVFSFNSIYLGPEVGVTLIGQRAFALVSKTNAVINTTFFAQPGMIGGMLGGGSVGRFPSDRLSDTPRDIYICDIGKYCSDPARQNITETFVSNNPNGRGSGNLRVTPFVVTTSAIDYKEIQVIRTFAQPGQTLAGGFALSFKKYVTPIIPHDCSSQLMKSILEDNLNLVQPANRRVLPDRYRDGIAGIGEVTVSRSTQSDEEGYTWSITFSTAIGNIDQMGHINYLQGLKAGMTLTTLQNGTEILGTFQLSYQGVVTQPILAAETAAGLKAKLLAMTTTTTMAAKSVTAGVNYFTAFPTVPAGTAVGQPVANADLLPANTVIVSIVGATVTLNSTFLAGRATATTFVVRIPLVISAFVTRIDPTQNCDDGLCPNGPQNGRGLIWTVYVTTPYSADNVSPNSPTDPLALQEGPMGTFNRFTAIYQGTLLGSISISFGTSTSPNTHMRELVITSPFSLAFGGSGASYGGLGGAGYSENPTGALYNDEMLTDLLGGSGGCMRGTDPFEINSLKGRTSGWGGHGGGAIEIVAANDIVIGTFGKLSVTGGDGFQSSQGGGGGGSGGAVLLAAGGTIVNDGYIDISGGHGGFGGFGHSDMVGGGGSGGRIALYGESVIQNGRVNTKGGHCGVYKSAVPESTLILNVSVQVLLPTLELGEQLKLDEARVVFLASTMINNTFPVTCTGITKMSYTIHSITKVINVILQVKIMDSALMASKDGNYTSRAYLTQIATSLASTTNLRISQVTFLKTVIALVPGAPDCNITRGHDGSIPHIMSCQFDHTVVTEYPVRSQFPPFKDYLHPCTTSGQPGSFYSSATMTTQMYVKETVAAEGTKRALFFSNNEVTKTTSGSPREAPFPANGPFISFEASRPTRVTYYTKIGAKAGVSDKQAFGALFTLISRGEAALAMSNVIGVFVGNTIMHGANFGTSVDEKAFLKRMVTIGNFPSVERWYKIDIKISWTSRSYTISIDDVIQATNQAFVGDDVDGVRLSVMRACDVWYDEIYVGFDNSMSFECPITSRDKGTVTMSPVQLHWSPDELRGPGDPNTAYVKKSRHYSHLEIVGSVPFDGQGIVSNAQDIKFAYPEGDYPATQGKLHAGALNTISNTLRSAKTSTGVSSTTASPPGVVGQGLWYAPADGKGGAGDGRQYWYTEYNFVSDFAASLNGGVVACSSQDMLSWRFEGVVFHYTNLTDMVNGGDGPFAAARPKVQFNAKTNTFIMWALMDNSLRSLAMSFVATSPYEDGPFLFKRSFFPDGNQTRDQVIFQMVENGVTKSVLARTYYATVEFLLPRAVMQPVWESVKRQDGSIDYRSSYLRSSYEPGYDNYHDIFYQRWRKEDNDWNVSCINKITGAVRYVASTEYTKPSEGYSVTDFGTVCIDPDEEKVILGQGGDPQFDRETGARLPISSTTVKTLFTGPDTAENSWWIQTSVPAVQAQPWANNYRDGYCGIRQLNEYLEIGDPNLATLTIEDRHYCSNIVDNPPHPALEDKFIGIQQVVGSRRAKFMALSELTDDLMDTTGNLNSFEGELDSGDLISMIIEMGQFGFAAGTTAKSTFAPPVRSEFDTAKDYKTRFRQYMSFPNDRASYSLACVIDGMCPVNFLDQMVQSYDLAVDVLSKDAFGKPLVVNYYEKIK